VNTPIHSAILMNRARRGSRTHSRSSLPSTAPRTRWRPSRRAQASSSTVHSKTSPPSAATTSGQSECPAAVTATVAHPDGSHRTAAETCPAHP